MDVGEEREFLCLHDMTDFSGKNKLPAPSKAKDVADIITALVLVSILVAEVYNTLVIDLLDAARRFLLFLRKIKSMRGFEAVPELTAWTDDRFECFRSCLARGDHEEAAHIKNHFQFNHESYARVVHRVTSLQVSAALKTSTPKQPPPKHRRSGQHFNEKARGKRPAKTIPIPPSAVIAALPVRRGKRLCIKCPGEGDTCTYDYRGHFVPAKLPSVVAKFIDKAYRGLRASQSVEEKEDPSL
ncbi:Canalicular multispecific organic anion transporter 1 [Phytophthora nicotianae]|uniref:Canalicular multispecific organic anion transporter 1 n=1 Tax=Phytophthora nicotianae TaxID=4792 RepID=A0A0W8D9F8_PHYNI|nr:Canalicular multispecific organic anion transporter 1 [Phytophthora nicotianae]